MNEQNLTQITIDRDKLIENFDEAALLISENTKTEIKPAVLLYCKSKGIIIELKENTVEFEKVY